MLDASDESAALAIALLRVPGAGRVATNRLVERFGSFDTLRGTPREQVLTRLPGIAGAEALVAHLFAGEFASAVDDARRELDALRSRRIRVLAPDHPLWPAGLADLERSQRPPVLYAFGRLDALARPSVAIFARPPLEDVAFETAQAAVRHLLRSGIVPVTGIQSGFDTVMCKLAASADAPLVAIASSGLARIPPPMRPAASSLTRAGGLLLSPFPMDHGPFGHDDHDRARTCAAVARSVVFAGAPPESPEDRATRWALGHARQVFSTTALPGADVPVIGPADDLDAIVRAATATEP